MQIILRIIVGIFIVLGSCTNSIDSYYEITNTSVYYHFWSEANGFEKRNVLNADPSTFQILEYNSYAKDEKNVYYNGNIVKDANPKRFNFHSEKYSYDDVSLFFLGLKIKQLKGKPNKVNIVNQNYAVTEEDVYYGDYPLGVKSTSKWQLIKGKEGWSSDGYYYYYEGNKIPSLKYSSLIIFEPYELGIAKDDEYVYLRGVKPNYNSEGIKCYDIDVSSFYVDKNGLCFDKNGSVDIFELSPLK